MTNNLKCPFCGAELQTHTMTPGRTLICVNKGCPVDSVIMKRIVWRTLIDGNKAQDALKIVEDKLQQISLGVETCVDPRAHAMTLVVIQSIAQDALKIITSITKQEE